MNKNYTVAEHQQLNVVARLLNEACSEVVKLPIKDLSSLEMEAVTTILESIVVSLEVRGLKRSLQPLRVCDKCGKSTGSTSTICDACFDKE